jgi:glutamyl/glutaminyl-tRNA synthetase
LPLLLNPDRSKMSKRGGDVAVEDYRQKGFRRDALINFVALLGWHPQDDRELFSVKELVQEFSLERVNKAGAIFDLAKLRWMNAEYIKRESDDELFQHVSAELAPEISAHGAANVRYAVQVMRGGTELYSELCERIRAVFAPRAAADPELSALLNTESAATFRVAFRATLSELPNATWTNFADLEAAFKLAANECGQSAGLKGKALWQTIRALLTGQPHGPELGKLIGIWGRERVLREIDSARDEKLAASSA